MWEQLFWEGKFKIPSSLAVTKGGKLLISKLNWPFWNYPLWRMAVCPLFLLKGRDFTLYSSVKQQWNFARKTNEEIVLWKAIPLSAVWPPLSLGQADERFPPPSPPSIARNSRENLRGGEQGQEDRWEEGVTSEDRRCRTKKRDKGRDVLKINIKKQVTHSNVFYVRL